MNTVFQETRTGGSTGGRTESSLIKKLATECWFYQQPCRADGTSWVLLLKSQLGGKMSLLQLADGKSGAPQGEALH